MTALNVGVAMSGGVDSTVAALLLSEQGWRVHGFFMRLPLPGRDAQLQRVREVADRLAVPLTMIDLEQPITDRVIRSFVDSYRAGLTPNPCMHCNEQIKFGLLAEAMRAAGMDRVATGHYARLVRAGGRARLARAAHRAKDQSYFLWGIPRDLLARTCFPLGDLTKTDTRSLAEDAGLPTARTLVRGFRHCRQ